MSGKPTYEELENRVQKLEQAELDRKRDMVSLRESEARHWMQPDNILLPEGDVGPLALADIMDTKSIQSMMDDFFKLTHIGVGIIDLHGKVLVATGWQDICTQFHRVHPETCNNCQESDIRLSDGVEPGTFRLYRCKNNMWDIATPITVGGKRMGNLFLGQFLFSDESPELDIFRSQARKYGFNEAEYLAALERVPRWSRETAITVMTFYAKLARLISELGFGNIKLARTLRERDNFLNSLLESEKNLRTTLNSIGDAVMVSDMEGNIVRMNPVAERLTGWNERDAAGKPLETVFRIINDASRETLESPAKKIFKENVIVGLANQMLLISKEGKEIPVTDSGAPIKNDDGKVTGMVLVFRDQTEERAAQKALEDSQKRLQENNELLTLFVRHSPVYCYIKEVKPTRSVVVQASDNFQQMIGIPGCEMIGKTMADLYPPEFAAKITADDWTVVSRGDILSLDEEWKGRSYTTIKFPIVQRGKTLLAGYTIDITDRKRAEAKKTELEIQNRQLQKAESLGRMAGAIAHHFNNQLQAVMGNLEMAMEGLPQGSNLLKHLTEALKASRKAAEVSGQMLTYRGQPSGKQVTLNLSEVCRQSLPLLQAAAPKGIILKADFPASGPIIHGNAGQMQQVLNNLVTNAWESTGVNPGDIHLTIKTVSSADIVVSKRFPIDWQPRENVYACLEVADEGCGIPDRDIEKIFDPFFSTKFTGRGMGLPSAIGIVQVHGGAVTVESRPGKGSVFRIFLPVSTQEATHSVEKPGITHEIAGGGTVLVVEDEEQVRTMIKMMLTRLGFTMLEARDGIEAVEIFRRHQKDIRIVICDLTMPSMNGWETLSALRKLSPNIPVILSSGYDEERVMAGDHAELPQTFLSKPYQLKELRDKIYRALANKAEM